MKEFNYQDYLVYQKFKIKEIYSISKLRDVSISYQLENIKVDKPHDKIFKIVLSEKKQVVLFLNRILKLEKRLTENDIERYSTEHIDYMFRRSESDIIYKMKNKEIFFLIEHQKTIDYSMPKRLLEYEVEIIKEATKEKIMTKKDHKLPAVVPIVIYTGGRKWNVEKYIKECQETLEGAESIKLGEYYVVDVNNYTKEQLEKDSLLLSKMLLLEKLKTEKEIFATLDRVTKKEKDENNRMILKRVIAFIIKEKLPSEKVEKLLKKLESEEKDMVVEVIRKENERQRKIGEKRGEKKGKLEVAKNLLKMGVSIENIQEATGLSKEKIQKMRITI